MFFTCSLMMKVRGPISIENLLKLEKGPVLNALTYSRGVVQLSHHLCG